MKTRKYVILGFLVLAFLVAPVATHAQTALDDYKEIIQQLGNMLNQLVFQTVSLVKNNPQDPAIDKYLDILPLVGQQQKTVVENFVQLVKSIRIPPPVTPSITVLSPNGGESWFINQQQTIKWKYQSLVGNVHMYLESPDGGYHWPSGQPCLIGVAPINQGGFSFTLTKNSCGVAGPIPAGSYKIWMYADNGNPDSSTWINKDQSDSQFKIYDSTTTNKPPSISGVSGPTTLEVGKSGTWSVTASDPKNGSLSYSVVWGDEVTIGTTAGGGAASVQQTATFTHTYSRAGTYSPTFTVTDDKGQSVRTSLSVVVGGGTTTNNPPKILGYEYPTSASVGQEVKFTWTAIDPDGDNLAWGGGFSDALGGGGFGQACPSSEPRTTFTVSHAWAQAGTCTVTIKVSDCRGGEDSRSIQFPLPLPVLLPRLLLIRLKISWPMLE